MTSDVDFELDEMQEIIDDFLVEADELIDSLDNNFVKLETNTDDPELLNEIFRAAHTIKGTSSFLGFDQVTTLSHRMEDILNKLRKSEMQLSAEIMDVLLEALDNLKVLLDKVREKDTEELDINNILQGLQAILDVESNGDTEAAVKEEPDPDQTDSFDQDAEIKALLEASAKKIDIPKVDINTSNVTATQKVKTKAPVKKPATDQTIRVDVNRLDSLMNMMGELVLGRNSLVQTMNKLNLENEGEFKLEQLNQSTNSVNFITTELQMAVMKMRMLPIGKVFNRYPRLVRDLARDAKKQIDLEIYGETTELDKSVIEEIGDPLVHIIRNSCDHGVETPEERLAIGKPAKGTVKLEASQEGSNIIIKVTDDGRGFDIKAIKRKAVEKGMTTELEVEKMTDKEVFNYILEPGFSTAKKVTDVSGRGVGMDVVRTNIVKLNGMVELDSKLNVGTVITIKLPLTLAIIQGLLVEADTEVFILPLASVYETVKTANSSMHYVNQRPVLRLRDEIIPIINLNELLNLNSSTFDLSDKPYIVIVGLAEKKLGIIVDRFLGQEEVVIKSLGSFLGNTEGIAGATILGDGRIRLIVDMMGMFKVAKQIC